MKKHILVFVMMLVHIIKPDGILDPSFGNGYGYVSLPAGLYARGLAMQANGKIIIVGSDDLDTFEVVRYAVNGSLDYTFNNTGIGESGGAGIPFSVLSLPDNSLVAVGQDQFGNYFKLVKYTAAGLLDVTFGIGGIVIGPQGFAVDSALQIDGKIIAAGNDNSGNCLVVRYNTNGSIDTSFTIGPVGFVESVKVQYDGKVLAAGTDNRGNMQLIRYNSDGTLDNTFGTEGVVTGPEGVATGLLIQSNGYYIVGGYNLSGPNMILLRYDTLGVLDESFGLSGVVTGPLNFLPNGIALQPDGYTVVAGDGLSGIKLTRYDTTGALDTTFGIGGIVTDALGFIYNVGFQQSNGYIIVVGTDIDANNYQVARYTDSSVPVDTVITSDTTQPVGTVTIAGTAQNPSQVYIYIDGQFIGSTDTDSGGANTWTFSTPIAYEGLYSVRVVSIYKNGNSSDSTGDILRLY